MAATTSLTSPAVAMAMPTALRTASYGDLGRVYFGMRACGFNGADSVSEDSAVVVMVGIENSFGHVARIMGIADVFEALTAADRPYKKGKTLTESLNILGKMTLGAHIDADIFDVFVQEKIYLDYARQFLDPVQIDEVDESKIGAGRMR